MEYLFIIFAVVSIVSNIIKRKNQKEAAQKRAEMQHNAPQTAPVQAAQRPHDPRFPEYMPQQARTNADPRFPEYTPQQARTNADPRFPELGNDSHPSQQRPVQQRPVQQRPPQPQQRPAQQQQRPAQQGSLPQRPQLVRESLQSTEGGGPRGSMPDMRTEGPGHRLGEHLTSTLTNIGSTNQGRHTLEASSLGGHWHGETSMDGFQEECPPGQRSAAGNAYKHAAAMAAPAALGEIGMEFGSPDALARGVLYAEILGKPKALRQVR